MYSMYGIWDTSDRRRLANWNLQLTLFALEESQNPETKNPRLLVVPRYNGKPWLSPTYQRIVTSMKVTFFGLDTVSPCLFAHLAPISLIFPGLRPQNCGGYLLYFRQDLGQFTSGPIDVGGELEDPPGPGTSNTCPSKQYFKQ